MNFEEPVFPHDFLWGVSTSAHQVEGGTYNQWSVWELEHAVELAKSAHKTYSHLPNWENIKDQAENPENYISGRGVDHYNQYKTDFAIARSLNATAFRFGMEWSRIEPEEGVWDLSAIEHYRDYIKQLKAQGLEPFLNIWHWTVPVWFEKKGGLTKRANLRYVERFVDKLAQEYIHEIKYIITLNEPNTYAANSFANGKWTPQLKSLFTAGVVYFNLVTLHKRLYRILKKAKPSLMVGSAPQLGNIQAKRPHSIGDEVTTQVMRNIWNWWFLNRTRKQHDFIGFNYYFTDYFSGWFKRKNPHVPLNDLGWYAEPEGLYSIILRVWARYKKPIIITENGIADSEDRMRRWWLEETIIALERAISEGVDIRGYFHWSLLDNFEWSDGWWPKFGLVEVDRKTMKRSVRPSAKWLATRIDEVMQGQK
jgi:beta-glucosidase